MRRVLFNTSLIVLAVLIFYLPLTEASVHYSGLPKVDRILWKFYEGAGSPSIIEDFINGVIDWIPMLGPENYSANYGCPACDLSQILINCKNYTGNGAPNTPLNYSSFRWALSYIYGMDSKTEDIYNVAQGDRVIVLGNPVPPTAEPWYNESIQMPNTYFDVAWNILQAEDFFINEERQLCDPNGQPIRDLEVWYTTGAIFWREGPGRGFVRNFNEFIAYIGAVSPTMTLEEKDFITILQALLTDDYDFICLGITGLPPGFDFIKDFASAVSEYGDPLMKEWAEIILTCVDPYSPEVIEAASNMQDRFVNYLMYWFPVCSSVKFSAIAHGLHPNGNLTNVVPMYGYCIENDWTWMAIHWEGEPGVVWPGGTLRRGLLVQPSTLNPYYENTTAGDEVLGRVLSQGISGLVGIVPLGGDPANINRIPFIAVKWNATKWVSIPELGIIEGSIVTFQLRQDVLWHDLTPLTAYDCVANLFFIAKWGPPRFAELLSNMVYAEPEGPYRFSVYFYAPGPYYLLISRAALLSPKHVLYRLEELIEDGIIPHPSDWVPYEWTYEEFMGVPPPPQYPYLKSLVGTGPFVFNYYDASLCVGEVDRFNEFFVNAPVISAVVGEWFHPVLVPTPSSTPYKYEVLVQNLLAKANTTEGEITNMTVYVKIYEDETLAHIVHNISLTTFESVYLGPYHMNLTHCCVHTIDVEVFDEETNQLIHRYHHRFVATIREDVTSYAGDMVDCKVDIRDVARVAVAFGSMPGHPRWDPPCDVNDDFKIDIRDIAAVARKFGWSC